MNVRSEIYLLRHAKSAPSPQFVPQWDWPLSVEGHAQAERLATRLAALQIDAIISSPSRRTLESVRPFARAAGLDIEICADLREAEGIKIWVDDFPAHVRHLWNDFDHQAEGLESHRQCQARMVRALGTIAVDHAGKTLLCSSHGQAIALFLHSIDPAFGYDDWAAMKMPDLRKVVWDGDRFSYVRTVREAIR